MYQDFISALNKKYGCSSKSELSGLDLQHYTFASTTNGRGRFAIGEFEAYGFSMKGMRILDVGCAYGGFAIEAAKKGAHCYGVEISQPLYEFACLNNQGESYPLGGGCCFIQVDATSPDFLEKLPHNYFDLIIVNDVFEHVYDTVQLLSNLSQVASESSAIYFVIPNGNDLRFVAKEGHSGQCGISLICPFFWHTLTKNHDIYYRQYEYYQALFRFFGFEHIVNTNYFTLGTQSNVKELVIQEYENAKQTISEQWDTLPERYILHLQTAIKKYDQQLTYDLAHMKMPELKWKYLTQFWAGFAHRSLPSLTPLKQTTERKFNSDDDTYGIRFVLSLDRDMLYLDVSCDYPAEQLDFAFHLMDRYGKSIERSSYQSDPHYKWKLTARGTYRAAIFVKKKEREHKDFCILTQPLYFSGE